jgi:methylated-DNA-[protein]-cysteine S-methyltransferase
MEWERASMNLTVQRIPSPIGTLLLVTDSQCVVRALDFEKYAARLARSLQDQFGEYELQESMEHSPAEASLQRYFAGELRALDEVEVALNGSEFQKQVWATLREIPPGTTISYGELARRLGLTDPKSAYEVGVANSKNPVALIVPCHRVVGKNGDLKGYAWGLKRKVWLLTHEKADWLRGNSQDGGIGQTLALDWR